MICKLRGQFRFAFRLYAALITCLPVAAAAAPSYPISARLQLGPQDRQHCLVLPDDPPDCTVVELARTAFAKTVDAMEDQMPVIIHAYDADTSATLGTVTLGGNVNTPPFKIVRWGTNGLAVAAGYNIFVYSGALVH